MRKNTSPTMILVGLLLIVAALAPVAAGGKGETAHEAPAGKLTVVATTSIVGDVVANVAGEAVDLTVLIPVGQNPHAYEPAPRAIAAVESADIVFVNGLDLEENLLDVVETTAGGKLVAVSHGIKVIGGEADHDDHDHDEEHHDDHDHDEEHHHEEADHDDHDDHDEEHHHHAAGDPHVWFSPLSILVWIDNIEDALVTADPTRAETFRSNAAAYRAQVTALDAEIRRRTEAIPRERRKLVVDHAALGYFARDYGFTVLGSVIPATTDQAEPSARAVAELVQLVREEEVPAIFVGGTASVGLRNLVEAVAAEVGRDVRVGTLLTGSLASPGNPGDTYLRFIEYNTSQIMEGLGY